jgi:hypothetical protein
MGMCLPIKQWCVISILSYGALLQSQGMIFNEMENGTILNWNQMAQEFLYWASQGWAVGIINLNPTNTSSHSAKTFVGSGQSCGADS